MKKIIITITLVCLAVVLALEPISLAWMSDNGMSSPVGITSNVHKSYFESGDGTAGSPLEIARPIQLYYFAWLQYLGYFNRDNDGDGKIDTYYFRISGKYYQDFDMTGYVLPPIGTQTNPFLGNLDGEGHTIKNLTVQNVTKTTGDSSTTVTDPPTNAGNTLEGVQIVGFMGVVGKITGDYTYDTQANEVKNLVLENLTVKTQTENALIGLVAGYVNGTVSGVGVANSKVDIQSSGKLGYTSNYSDYSLIGYCTNSCKDGINVMDVDLTQPQTVGPYDVVPETGNGGTATGWGGSVAMKSIFDLIGGLANTTNNAYITERVDLVINNDDGSVNKMVTVDTTVSSDAKRTVTMPGLGSFVFTTMNHQGGVNFIGGSQEVTKIQYEKTTVASDSPIKLYYITDGTNYLCFDGSIISNAAKTEGNAGAPANATKWYVSNNENGGLIYTEINNVVYYLVIENNNITATWKVDPDSLADWTVNNGEIQYNSQKINFVEGEWQATVRYYKIASEDGKNYLSINSTNTGVTNQKNSNDATNWIINTSSTTTTISTVVGTTTYYLVRDNNGGLTVDDEPMSWTYDANNQRFYVAVRIYEQYDFTWNYYIRYSSSGGGGWSTDYDSYEVKLTELADSSTVKAKVAGAGTTTTKIGYKKVSYIDNSLENYYYGENGEKVYTGTDHAGLTYIPLSIEGNAVSTKNTGYIIGSDWDSTTKTDSQDGNDSNLRISAYTASSNLTNRATPYVISHETVKLSTLPTLPSPSGDDGFTDAELEEIAGYGIFKYADAYNAYYSSVKDTYSYGLHFMNAPVSIGNTARITATLQGAEEPIENYQVPTNCIDFNLYKKGFINAVAGTYYAQGKGNDSFFSIYQIFRRGTEITEIKEIKEIYGKLTPSGKIDRSEGYDYVYVYGDGTTSGSMDDTYKPIFDCKWITDTEEQFKNGKGWSDNRAYYFEVPVNAGEYALGSTSGKTGAYLIYLDLAANAELTKRTKTYEVITETQGVANFPKGVELLDANNITIDENNNVIVNPADSAFAAISNATGEIAFKKSDTNNTVTVTRDREKGSINAAYIGSGSLLDGSTPLVVQAGNLTVQNKVIQRTTYSDFNTSNEVTTVTVITHVTVTNASGTIIDEWWEKSIDGGTPQTSTTELFPETKDNVSIGTGDDLVSLSFNSTSATVSISYVYSSGTNRYDVTITSDTALSVTATWLDTSDAAATVVINGTTTLTKTTNPQTVSVAATSGT